MARILIVEDDDSMRTLYTLALEKEGHTIETAVDGESAFSKMKQGGYDLVLLDIILPKMSGLDVVEKLSSDPPLAPNKTIIFLSNLDQGEEIKGVLKLGMGYLLKSEITPGDLVQKVNLYLSK